jgi:hypothetical protein
MCKICRYCNSVYDYPTLRTIQDYKNEIGKILKIKPSGRTVDGDPFWSMDSKSDLIRLAQTVKKLVLNKKKKIV